eukprot:gene9293-19287_t
MIGFLHAIVFCLVLYLRNCAAWQCDIEQYYFDGVGLSVYAGRDFNENESIEIGVGVAVPLSVFRHNELYNYIAGFNDTHSEVNLGFNMIYNHEPLMNGRELMIRKYREQFSALFFHATKEGSHDVNYVAGRHISKGDQIFNHYGEKWFSSRGEKEGPHCEDGDQNNFCKISENDNEALLRKIPGCAISFTDLKAGRMY